MGMFDDIPVTSPPQEGGGASIQSTGMFDDIPSTNALTNAPEPTFGTPEHAAWKAAQPKNVFGQPLRDPYAGKTYGETVSGKAGESAEQMKRGLSEIWPSEEELRRPKSVGERLTAPLRAAGSLYDVAAGAAGYVASPITAAVRKGVTSPLGYYTGIPAESIEEAAMAGVGGVEGKALSGAESLESLAGTQPLQRTPIKVAPTGRAMTTEPLRMGRETEVLKAGANLATGEHPARIDQRLPTSKRVFGTDPENLKVDVAAAKESPNAYANNVDLLRGYPNMPAKLASGSDDKVANGFVDHVADNLKWLWDQVPPEVRDRSIQWYDGGNKIVKDLAQEYRLRDSTAAAVLASLSPQKDWFQNVSLARRTLDIMRNKDVAATPEMARQFVSRESLQKYAPIFDRMNGKSLADIDQMDDLSPESRSAMKAMFVRLYDEAHKDPSHRIVTPEGEFGDYVKADSGANRKIGWGTIADISKAVEAIERDDPTAAQTLLGGKHKVRNFYNNLLSPNSATGDVTIDTHAVAAGLLRPLSGKSIEVAHNFENYPGRDLPTAAGSDVTGVRGTYPFYADAYRKAAEAVGVLPRQLQSVTWEAVRSLFPENIKNAKFQAEVDGIWDRYRKGRATLDDTRNKILAAAGAEGGIKPPSWFETRPGAGADEGLSHRADEAELSRSGVPRQAAEGIGGGGGEQPAATIPGKVRPAATEGGLNEPEIGRQPLQRTPTKVALTGRAMATKPLPIGNESAVLEAGLQRVAAAREPSSPAPPFYSAVARGIESVKQPKASPQQWLGMLKNMPGVKQEELSWLGLEDWLKEQKGSVSKAQIADYVRANQIEVREVEKGANAALTEQEKSELRSLQARDDVLQGAIPRYPEFEALTPPERQRMADLLQRQNYASTTKFSKYTLPGAEPGSYRELLLTLPQKLEPSAANIADARRFLRGELNGEPAKLGFDTDDKVLAEAQRRGMIGQGQNQFTSSHFDEPNILAHVRMNDRVIDGKKTLFVEEVQSDWHQKGRERGYASDIDAAKAELDRLNQEYEAERDRRNAFRNADDQAGAEAATARMLSIGDRMNAIHDRVDTAQRQGVPDAPFKTTWPELAMKRMIRYAAENGYDKVAWTSGETQAARYDLSKQINKLDVERLPSKHGDVYKIAATGKDGRSHDLSAPSEAALADTVGKEMAEKIATNKENKQSYSGLDLKVGGEGMKGFYDQILPATVNKLVKKFGGKVGEGEVEPNPKGWHITPPDRTVSGKWMVKSNDYNSKGFHFDTEEEARANLEQNIKGERAAQPVHTLDISDKLRETATEQGFPLFRVPRGWKAAEGQGEPQGQKVRIGRDTYAYVNPIYTAKEQEIGDAVKAIGTRMAPRANVRGVAALRQSGSPIWGGFVNSEAFPQLITWSLEKGAAGQIGQTVRHEIIHHLRNIGLFAPDEWKALRDAAVHDGWLQQHNIYERYPDLSADHKVEEAVAEQFGKWRAERSLVKPGLIRDAFMRLDLFLRRVAAAVRKAMGFNATPSDIFTRIETGEVGRREPIKRASGGRVESGTGKRTRDSFGYMEPSPNIPDFAQCGSCQLWIKDRDRCYWFSDSKKVEASDSCTEYVQGEPIKGDVKASNSLDPKEAGFIKGSTRCENCVSFNKDKPSCMLFENLNRAQPDIFDLDEKVKPRGCCNAFARDPAKHEKVIRRASGGRIVSHYIDRNPSEAQKRAGNYRHAHIDVHGLDISIENAKGHERSGIGKNGKPWRIRLPANYGYIKRTEGADGDHVDCYVGPHIRSRKVFVVDQHDADTGRFDEHKCMLGFASEKQARDTYHRGFSDGRGKERLGHLTEMSIDQFKHWIRGDTKNPVKGTEHAPKIDTTKDVRWMSEMSKSGDTYYRDRSLPKQIINNGKWLPIDEPLKRHEVAEYNAIKKMVEYFEFKHGRKPDDAEREAIYLKSHKEHGEVAEHNWLKENGFDVKAWENWCHGKLDYLEHKRVSKPVPDPHVRPSPHDRRRLEAMQ